MLLSQPVNQDIDSKYKKEFIMPRCARLTLARILWHSIQRGNNRSACFYCAEDYHYSLHPLKNPLSRFGCAVHA